MEINSRKKASLVLLRFIQTLYSCLPQKEPSCYSVNVHVLIQSHEAQALDIKD